MLFLSMVSLSETLCLALLELSPEILVVHAPSLKAIAACSYMLRIISSDRECCQNPCYGEDEHQADQVGDDQDQVFGE